MHVLKLCLIADKLLRATTILPKDKYAKKVGEKVPKGLIPAENAAASYEEAAKACRDKVDKM